EKSFFGKEASEQRRQTFGSFSKAAGSLQEAATGLPSLLKKADSFLDSLKKTGKSLPDLVTEAEITISDADKTAKAAQKSWLLRRNVPKPKEHTIRMDADPGKN
ncbi:MAG: hypothetical protein M1438_12960, partial [Deltaproteobacteria bacterium]|nr:hypothetical protein [Deltaproteobacteria bacterium]